MKLKNKMNFINRFIERKRAKRDFNQALDLQINNLLVGVTEYLDSNDFRRAYSLIRQADKLYSLRSYDFDTEIKINDAHFSFLEKYFDINSAD